MNKNKYLKWYVELIQKALYENLDSATKIEVHHIVPRSEGGSDDKTNLVNLTYRQHLIAHLLLARIYNDSKMWYAVSLMSTDMKHGRLNSRLYAKIREAITDDMKKRWADPAYREKMKNRENAMRGKTGAKHHWFGKHQSDEAKHKIAETSAQRWADPEFKKRVSEKLSEAAIGRVLSKENIDKMRKTKLDQHLHWYNNGTEQILAAQCPDGFKPGGLPASEELKEKFRISHLGQIPWNKGGHMSEKTRAKVSESTKIAMQRPEVRAKVLAKNCKPVQQFDLDGNLVAEYPSIIDAAKESGVSYPMIRRCLKGKIEKAKNFRFSFKL